MYYVMLKQVLKLINGSKVYSAFYLFSLIFIDRWEEAMGLCSKLYTTPMNGLVQYLPEVSMVRKNTNSQ